MDLHQWLHNGAIISSKPGHILIGWGKHKRLTQPKETNQKAIFYFPDFFLTDPEPWFDFEYVIECEIDALKLICEKEIDIEKAEHIRPSWLNHYEYFFINAFDSIQEKINSKELDKAVPFVFEISLNEMSKIQLLQSLYNILKNLKDHAVYVYGFWSEEEGMLGLTPEILFKQHNNNQLLTIACAGTSRKEDCSAQFMSDTKQLHEHQLVIKGIVESLSPFGEVSVGNKELLSLPNINHLVTPITVNAEKFPKFETLVEVLHPTPALGAFPKNSGMEWLKKYQEKINRGRFGAPVGYIKNECSACYVAIRNVQWNQKEMRIGAGCGIVQGSQCQNEWAEINLKLKATKAMLDL